MDLLARCLLGARCYGVQWFALIERVCLSLIEEMDVFLMFVVVCHNGSVLLAHAQLQVMEASPQDDLCICVELCFVCCLVC